jgi:hypothetical protein
VTKPQHRADVFVDPASDPREGGTSLGDERATLIEFLRSQRLTLKINARAWMQNSWLVDPLSRQRFLCWV